LNRILEKFDGFTFEERNLYLDELYTDSQQEKEPTWYLNSYRNSSISYDRPLIDHIESGIEFITKNSANVE
jgi:hypothetical protein